MPQGAIPSEAIIEQEHQKRLAYHVIAIRPDIIVPEPFDHARHRDRDEGNYVVMELKRRGSAAQALEDCGSLCSCSQRAITNSECL